MKQHRLVRVAVIAVLAVAAGPLAAARAGAGEFAVEGLAGYHQIAAANSASAVFGSDDGVTFGGGLRQTFWRGAFASAGVRTFSKQGERVFVASTSSPVQKLGFPLEMRTTAFHLALGWRLRRGHLIVPYLYAGGALTRYQETSTVAGESFDRSASKAGLIGAAGVEVGRGRLRLAAEAGRWTAPDAIGAEGVSKVYGEKDAGGVFVVGKLVFAFGD